PSLKEPKVAPPSYSYIFPNVAYKPKAVYSPIDPVFIKPEQKEDLFDNYIEIGGGNYLTSYVDASIHNTQDKYYTYGLRLKHHAASSSNNPEQGLFSQNRITAFGSREKGNDLSGEIDYQRNVVHYYGYIVDTPSLELNDINQIYNDINANLLWSLKKAKVTSDLDIGFNLFDKLGENESTVDLTFENSFKAGKGKFHLDLGTAYTQLTETAKYNRFFLDVKPHLEFKYKKINYDIGLLINYFLDFNTNKIYPSPYIKAETYLVPKRLKAYAGLIGGLEKNTLRDLSYDNLFLGNNLTYTNPRTLLNAYIGMKGNFKRFVEYGIKLSQEIIEDQYLFINDTNMLRNFTTVTDDMSKFTFSGEMKFDVNQNVDLGFRGNFYAYSMSLESEAWHLPSYDAALFATVRLAEKIYIRGGYFATSTRKARDLKSNEYNLAAINDINLGFEYRYKSNISAFLNVNNILNQRYEIWNYYRAQGLNALAGVTFSL
ncbi:MAG: hypothetical protein KJP21_07940, partial [Bacteroidia bacterium]|nr:hypothetical protein [Bacteroidia bacterium]NNJ55460.1 hypothetical protein [Bacteroidia bacterium]